MFGPNNAGAVASLPARVNTGPSGFFGAGNPATGILPTLLDQDFMNGLLQELFAILTQAGIAPSATAFNQLLLAIETVAQQVGDARYLRTGATSTYLPLAGGTMTGPLTTDGLNATSGATVPTAAAGDNSQAAASTAFVYAALAALEGGETGVLATLHGLAAALNQDSNLANDLLAAIGQKLALSGGNMTGPLGLSGGSTTPTGAAGAGGTTVASQGYADASAAAAAAPKANTAGQAFTGPVSAPSLTSAGAVTTATGVVIGATTALNADGSGNLGLNAAAGAGISLRSGTTTVAEIDNDFFMRLDTILPRTANDSRAARTDFVKGVGLRANATSVQGTYSIQASDVGSFILANGFGAVLTLPLMSSVEPYSLITIYANQTFTIQTPSGSGNYISNYQADFTSILVPQGKTLQLVAFDSSHWRPSIDPAAFGGKLQTLPGYPVTVPSGTATYDLTWSAATYDRLLLTGKSLSSAGTSGATSVIVSAFRDGGGTWTNISGLLVELAPNGGDGAVTVQGGNLGVSQITNANNSYGYNGILNTAALTHSGGLSGLRLAPQSGTSFSGGPINLSGA